MKIKNIGIAAKYTCIVLTGCAVTVAAAETVSSLGKNDVPVLSASNSTAFSSSAEHSATYTPVSTPSPLSTPSSSSISTASSSAPLSSAQSSTSVSSPVISEPSELPVDEPPDEPISSSEQAVPTESTSELVSAPVQSSEYPWGITDEDWYGYPQTASGVIWSSTEITSSSTSVDSSTPQMSVSEPTVSSSAEPPIQSDETTASSVEPPESVVPDLPEFVIVNINTATVGELTQLDGIGEDKALAIIEFRERFGGFTSIYEIREVDGIGDSVFERIRDFIVI